MRAWAIEYTSAARRDVLESKQWYESKQIGLGHQFSIRIGEAMERISHQPLGGAEIHRGVRRVVVRGIRHQRENLASWPEL